MYDGLDFIMTPISEGMCKYESAKDGTLSLLDFAIMNDAIAVKYENRARAEEAAKRQRT